MYENINLHPNNVAVAGGMADTLSLSANARAGQW